MPFIGGAIGWFTNMLAIRMLFRPRQPIRLPLLPITCQGLLPKCKAELALNIGKAVEEELLPIDTLIKQLDNGDYQAGLVETIGTHIEERFIQSLPRLLPESLRKTFGRYGRDMVAVELPTLLDKLTEQVKNNLRTELRVGPLIEERIMQFDLGELEQLIIRVTHRELRHLELLGAALGFLIGMAQAALVLTIS